MSECKEDDCYAQATNGRRCYECFKAANRASFHKNKSNNPSAKYSAKTYWTRLWVKFKMTEDDYNSILSSQSGGCAICGGTDAGKRNTRMPVDHDHITGDVRGILCTPCNRGIGLMRDNAKLLAKASMYVSGSYS